MAEALLFGQRFGIAGTRQTSMPVKKKKRRKGRAPGKRPRVLESRERCTDSEQVKKTLEKFELDVGGFDYRTDVSVGPMKTESISKGSHVIAAMIKMPNARRSD